MKWQNSILPQRTPKLVAATITRDYTEQPYGGFETSAIAELALRSGIPGKRRFEMGAAFGDYSA